MRFPSPRRHGPYAEVNVAGESEEQADRVLGADDVHAAGACEDDSAFSQLVDRVLVVSGTVALEPTQSRL
jgi:hypothetical protein